MSTFPDKLRQIAAALESGEIQSQAIPLGYIENMGEAGEKYTSSYIRITMSRALKFGKASIKLDKNYQPMRTFTNEDGVEEVDDSLEPSYIITYTPNDGGAANERKSRKDDPAFKAGLKQGLDVGISFVPDFVDYTPEQFEVAQGIVKQYRAHLETVKEGLQ